ncbi:MAG: non-homologous end-joining DNA ligase, partial [Myxococcales bacterium]
MPTRTAAPVLHGVRISHPDRVVYPEPGLTKLGLARYHDAVAEWALPHLLHRPLTLLRCPNAIGDGCAFMRHSRVWAPAPLRKVEIPEKTKVGEYLYVDGVPSLLALVQMDALELHTWNSRIDAVEQPDRVVLDLDPGPEVRWAEVVEAAKLLRTLLEALGLASFVKTTGGRGLHVVVPLAPVHDWTVCLAFARNLASALARHDPRRFTTAYAKRGREKKLPLDYLRNNRPTTS